jgi:two-component system, NarL family, response regulator DevR
MIDVFLLAENRILRESLLRLLGKRDDIRVVGAASLPGQSLEQISLSGAQVLVTDSAGSSALDLRFVSEILTTMPELKIVMIGMEEDKGTLLHAIRYGVVGYVLKEASALEVVAAIRSVANGEAVCPPTLCMTLFKYVSSQFALVPNVQIKRDLDLTRREQQLLQMLTLGLTNKEIASQLFLSEQTVKNHVHRILRKVGVSDRMEVVETCRLQGLTA